MNKVEMSKALEIAQSNRQFTETQLNESYKLFDGYGLINFESVFCTIESVAILIRYQAQYLNGDFDFDEINSIAKIGKHKFIII